jgi:hypothetical protein
MTTTSPLQQLEQALDELDTQVSVLEHAALLGIKPVDAIGEQLIGWAAQGWVTISGDVRARRVRDSTPPALRPDEACLYQLTLYTSGDPKYVSADFTPDFIGREQRWDQGQRATWKLLRAPVNQAVRQRLEDTGKVKRRLVPNRRLRRAIAITAPTLLALALAALGVLTTPMLPYLMVCVVIVPALTITAVIGSIRPFRLPLTAQGRQLAQQSRQFATAMRTLLDERDPLPPTQSALDFYERALPIAMLHRMSRPWQTRLRQHYARDTTRHTRLLTDPSTTDYSRFTQRVSTAIHGVIPPGNGSQ